MSNCWSRFSSFISLLLAGMLVLPACSETPAPSVPQVLSPAEAHARAWADSTLATLNPRQKAAQLVFVAAPAGLDSAARLAFADSLAHFKFGGLVMDVGQRDTLRLLGEACRDHAEVPLWVALDAGPAWSAAQEWPSLLSVGTVASDSLAALWGNALAAESQFLGAQICMVSAGKVAQTGTWTRDAFSAVPAVVARLSDSLVAGMERVGVQVVVRPLVEAVDFHSMNTNEPAPRFKDGLQELNAGKAMPIQQLIVQHPHIWMQSTTATFTAIDSLPIARSQRAQGYFLRQKLAFEGMLMSPREGDINHLLAGADVLVAPKDPFAAVSSILAAVESGQLSQTLLDSLVRKQLLAKARMGLDKRPQQHMVSVDPQGRLAQLSRAINKATMVVLRDTKGRLPLGANITNSKIATVAYGIGHITEMQVAMEAYAPMDHYLIGIKADSLALARQLELLKQYDYVVLSLHQPLVVDALDPHFPIRTLKFLEKLDSLTRLVVVDFAERNTLEDLRELSCLAFVSEDMDRSANLAGQALMGAFPVTALLPDAVSPSFPAGTGKVLPKKIRFEYTDPEDLGINPNMLKRIDSLLENAIQRGVFPGCQVFAAKDGKVFLHQSYGYHDYERSLRVRNDHLYDIASVSKIAATTLMAMSAFDLDTLLLNQPLKYFMPDLDSSFVTIKDITPQQLLTHSAGLPAGIVLNKYFRMISAPDSIRNKIYSKTPDSLHTVRIAEELYLAPSYRDTVWNRVRRIYVGAPGNYEYSDLSMYLMKALLERILGKEIKDYVQENYYQPMGLRRICYNPLDKFEKEDIVPTANDRFWRRQVLRGDVHDPTVAFLGGVGGPAGIFSNSNDLATIMQMLLNGGSYGGRQYFKPETVQLFTSRQPGSRRGLGFDKQLPAPSCEKGYCCFSADPETFGHFGFTGTCAWADPRNQIVYVFLSNRVYPDDDNKKINAYRIRQGVQQLIYDALGLGIPSDEGLMAGEQECYLE